MKTFYLGLFLLSAGIINAQNARVGINTKDPKTTLDVSGKTDASGNVLVADMTGFQAPRITLAELSAKGDVYKAKQIGALIYITDVTGGNKTTQRVNISRVGYYFFDGSVWFPIKPEPWYGVTTNTDASSNTQDIYQMGKVGIGTKTPAYQLEVIGEIKGERLIGTGAGGIDTNSAVGDYALLSNTTGSGNVATGYIALGSNGTGNYNVAFGAYSSNRNTTGSYNTAIGFRSFIFNETGSYNVALGDTRSGANGQGSYNVAKASGSLVQNVTGKYNIAIGTGALNTTTGSSYNIAIGGNLSAHPANLYYTASLGNNALVAGNSDMSLGYLSGINAFNGTLTAGYPPTGNNNVSIGPCLIGLPTNGLSNSIAITTDSPGGRKVYVDSNGNVGINITSITPVVTSKLQVIGLPKYANDAAAGAAGLTAGAFYILPDGQLAAKL